jgi:hypothetical protein
MFQKKLSFRSSPEVIDIEEELPRPPAKIAVLSSPDRQLSAASSEAAESRASEEPEAVKNGTSAPEVYLCIVLK